jgi:hypothetical protein
MLCPRCDSLLVIQHQIASPLDRLLALLAIQPFECQACRHRFRGKPDAVRAGAPPDERRKLLRSAVSIPVNFECGVESSEGTLTDLSKDGCTLDSKRRLKPGLLLRLHLPSGSGETSPALAQQIATVRSVQGTRAGLKFLAFTPTEQAQLEQTVTSTIKRFTKP